MSDIFVREYKQEDLEKVYNLYKSQLDRYVHFCRNIEVIKHFTQFRSKNRRVYVAVSGEKETKSSGYLNSNVLGFLIVAVTERKEYARGMIEELCSVNEDVAKCLVEKALAYCTQKGVDVIAAAPLSSEDAKAFSRSNGWFKANPHLIVGTVISPAYVLRLMLKSKLAIVESFTDGISFVLGKNKLHVETKGASLRVNVVEGNAVHADVSVEMSNSVFTEIVMRAANPYKMYLLRRIKIKKRKGTSLTFKNFLDKFKILKLIASIRFPDTLRVAIIDAL